MNVNAKSNSQGTKAAARQDRKQTLSIDVEREAGRLQKFREDLEQSQGRDETSIRASLLGRHE